MKTLYFDCQMGAAGDMLTAALYELLDDEGRTLRALPSPLLLRIPLDRRLIDVFSN